METKITLSKCDELLSSFQSSSNGLTDEQVKARQSQSGLNELQAKKVSFIKVFFQQYANFLMLLMGIGVLFSIYEREFVDAFMIIAVLIVNGILGTIQEYRAEKLTQALSAHIPQKVTVRRNGQEKIIDRKELVCGDIVILSNGQLVPADMRVIKNFGLVVDESSLTGESIGVAKQEEPLDIEPKDIQAMKNIVFSGTPVLQGDCEAVVIATGQTTEFGKIVTLSHSTKKRSSFLNQVNGLSRFLFKATLLITGVLFLVLIFFKSELGINELFLFSIALSIAIVPQMLPLISTVALTRATLALAKKGVFIKRLSSLEDLGGIEIICTDKTGTITENKLKIVDIVSGDAEQCLYSALLSFKPVSDPDHILSGSFDAAIWNKVGVEHKKQYKTEQRIWEAVFDPYRRWQFAIYKTVEDAQLNISGAPESILPNTTLTPAQQAKVLDEVIKKGTEGFRVLAIASKRIKQKQNYNAEDVNRLIFIGLLVFEDAIKTSAAESLERAHEMGVRIKLVTGDTPEVAMAVSKKIGLQVSDSEVITGAQLALIPDHKQHQAIMRAKIFARVDPKDKNKIIQTLATKHSVMFLGEGVNDALALKTADVGIVVQEASDIAKESADIVLTKPDLSVIVDSIYYGRQIMTNISSYILITLSGNFGTLYAIGLISLIAPILPLLPTQVLLENILTDLPMVSLVNNPVGRKYRHKPVEQNIRSIAFNAVIFGIAILITQFIFYRLFSSLPTDLFRTLWLTEVVLTEFMLIITLRTTNVFWKADPIHFNSKLFFIGVVAFILLLPFIPYVNKLFHLVPYSLYYLLPILLIVIVGMVIVEIIKKFILRGSYFNLRT